MGLLLGAFKSNVLLHLKVKQAWKNVGDRHAKKCSLQVQKGCKIADTISNQASTCCKYCTEEITKKLQVGIVAFRLILVD